MRRIHASKAQHRTPKPTSFSNFRTTAEWGTPPCRSNFLIYMSSCLPNMCCLFIMLQLLNVQLLFGMNIRTMVHSFSDITRTLLTVVTEKLLIFLSIYFSYEHQDFLASLHWKIITHVLNSLWVTNRRVSFKHFPFYSVFLLLSLTFLRRWSYDSMLNLGR